MENNGGEICAGSGGDVTLPLARWEAIVIGAAVALALVLGFSNLGKPSVGHDESVHIYVANSILEKGWPQQPSGMTYVSGVFHSLITAGFIRALGSADEVAVRAPSVIIGALSVLVAFLLVRRLLGRPAALITALFLATSPWSVAWSRQANFYGLQELLYLLFLWLTWRLVSAPPSRQWLRQTGPPIVVYALGVLTALHSPLFLCPLAAYAFLRGATSRLHRRGWLALCCVAVLLGILTMLIMRATLPSADVDAIFKAGALGGKLADPKFDIDRSPRFFYFIWLKNNLGVGFLALALFGFAAMLTRERWRGVYVALAFWVPLFVLTYLVGYRRERFMYFAYPLYVAAYSYGIVCLARIVPKARRSWLHAVTACCIVVFAGRLGWSTVRLVGNSIETARGADLTLALLHPQWRKPCLYVRDHRNGDAVLSTAYMPALYYIGQVDDWYPSRIIFWEYWESGSHGLQTVDDLKRFVTEHPRGYFIAEYQRFNRWKQYAEDIAWVEANMKRIDEGSSRDISVYAWGI
ncbi:MAG: glycosyltransferase family 39 protein [Candidatus Hydrogenedentes bacterium]|nr:glycosyltransferase family 39 protein [Candidatus Hydrogenedentota bacterium]